MTVNSEQSGGRLQKAIADLHAVFPIVGTVVVAGVAAGSLAGCSGKAGTTSAAAKTPSQSASTVPSTAPSMPMRSIVIPKTVGDYQLLTGDKMTQMTQGLRKSLAHDPHNGQYAEIAKIGIFANAQDPQNQIYFIGLAGKDDPRLAAEMKSHSPSDELSRFSEGDAERGNDYPPGPLGGALRCEKRAEDGTLACGWADTSTVGTVVFTGATSGAEAARIVTAVRQAAER